MVSNRSLAFYLIKIFPIGCYYEVLPLPLYLSLSSSVLLSFASVAGCIVAEFILGSAAAH